MITFLETSAAFPISGNRPRSVALGLDVGHCGTDLLSRPTSREPVSMVLYSYKTASPMSSRWLRGSIPSAGRWTYIFAWHGVHRTDLPQAFRPADGQTRQDRFAGVDPHPRHSLDANVACLSHSVGEATSPGRLDDCPLAREAGEGDWNPRSADASRVRALGTRHLKPLRRPL